MLKGKIKPIFSVFFHNYYGDDQNWFSFFANEINYPFQLFYNGVYGSYYRTRQNFNYTDNFAGTTTSSLIRAYVMNSPNKGKDIGGKLVLMDAYLRLGIQSDYILLLHDKRSPYHTNNHQWKDDLFRIVKQGCLPQVLNIFDNNPKIGIVASGNAIRNEIDNEQQSNAYTTSNLIKGLKNKYNIDLVNLQYVAGTMFCVRAPLFEEFFRIHLPLEIRSTLESGNVTDHNGVTITHAWERLFCWLITSRGYQIKGI